MALMRLKYSFNRNWELGATNVSYSLLLISSISIKHDKSKFMKSVNIKYAVSCKEKPKHIVIQSLLITFMLDRTGVFDTKSIILDINE